MRVWHPLSITVLDEQHLLIGKLIIRRDIYFTKFRVSYYLNTIIKVYVSLYNYEVTFCTVLIYKIHLFIFFTSVNMNKINESTYMVETTSHSHTYIYTYPMSVSCL